MTRRLLAVATLLALALAVGCSHAQTWPPTGSRLS
jgi:hypothetical protein